MPVHLILNLQYITDPRSYLFKQKLKYLALNPAKIVHKVILTTPSGLAYELAENITNADVITLIQDIIDATCDSMTSWSEITDVRYHSHEPPNGTRNGTLDTEAGAGAGTGAKIGIGSDVSI